ncbi:MAG: hypothetical protein KJ624_01475 [Chloroflexi bacterium]|nr:hypothetical protein [Chloroflexota bacterium]
MERQQRLLLSLFGVGAAVMLLGALGDREYSYYTLLRWVVSFAAVLVAILGLRLGHIWAVGVFAFVAVLYNPLAPVNLSRDLWLFIDIAAAVLFLLAVALVGHPGAVVEELRRHDIWVALALAVGIILAVTLGILVYSKFASSLTTRNPTPTPYPPFQRGPYNPETGLYDLIPQSGMSPTPYPLYMPEQYPVTGRSPTPYPPYNFETGRFE